jgi:hypothetical protein
MSRSVRLWPDLPATHRGGEAQRRELPQLSHEVDLLPNAETAEISNAEIAETDCSGEPPRVAAQRAAQDRATPELKASPALALLSNSGAARFGRRPVAGVTRGAPRSRRSRRFI